MAKVMQEQVSISLEMLLSRRPSLRRRSRGARRNLIVEFDQRSKPPVVQEPYIQRAYIPRARDPFRSQGVHRNERGYWVNGNGYILPIPPQGPRFPR